jgi:medium-chain acyl-CoA ligase, mitochondrial
LNPAYQLPELDYCLKKAGVKAIVAPESFRKQNLYEMLMNLVPDVRSNSVNSLQNIIIAADSKLP